MRPTRAKSCDTRSNALWGRGSRGESRSNALWGRGGRRAGAVLAVIATAAVFAAGASAGGGSGVFHNSSTWSIPGIGGINNLKAYVPSSLLSAIQQNPTQSFDVILEGNSKSRSNALVNFVLNATNTSDGVRQNQVRNRFQAIDGLHLQLTGRQIVLLAHLPFVSAIVPNETVQMTSWQLPAYNTQMWPWVVGAPVDWTGSSPATPTIAIVDSGIDATRSDFGSRVLGQVNLASLSPNAT